MSVWGVGVAVDGVSSAPPIPTLWTCVRSINVCISYISNKINRFGGVRISCRITCRMLFCLFFGSRTISRLFIVFYLMICQENLIKNVKSFDFNTFLFCVITFLGRELSRLLEGRFSHFHFALLCLLKWSYSAFPLRLITPFISQYYAFFAKLRLLEGRYNVF